MLQPAARVIGPDVRNGVSCRQRVQILLASNCGVQDAQQSPMRELDGAGFNIELNLPTLAIWNIGLNGLAE
jgi:hypothetical protein